MYNRKETNSMDNNDYLTNETCDTHEELYGAEEDEEQ